MNPYCEVIVDGQRSANLRTEALKRTDTPEWDEEFTVYVRERGGTYGIVQLAIWKTKSILICTVNFAL